ncbi:MAG: bifunctional pyr operon transcriptional regulator/uracil phosphoribosyltransferase PyrR [Acidimicrobiia bacterium]
MTATTQVLTRDDLRRAIHRIAHEIVERHHGASDVVLVGIHTRGVPLALSIAQAIQEFEGIEVPVGELDIGLYRDDLGRRHATRLGRTSIPIDISGRPVVLVDDVLFTGRTIRAALDALSDLGRASFIQLAVLVDRGHRQLPIRPDYVGKNLPTSPEERVWVRIADIDGESGVWLGDEEAES